ncbi:MAG: metal-dependent hydrolase [Anaerolineales bacterium]|nr:metal-dependent hydrolase [Anaerolineales bacterium]
MDTQFTYYGHSTFGLKINGHPILIDPFFTGNPTLDLSPDELDADFILVTHGHGDHIGDTVRIAKRTDALVIACFEVANWLEEKGVKTHAQHIGGGFQHPFGYVKMTQALHGSSLPDGSYGGMPGGFLITTEDNYTIYLAGDTGLFPGMSLIGDEGIDFAALPIGDNFTMGPKDALRAVKLLKPRRVLPTHYSTFDLINQDPEQWKANVEAETNSEVVILKPRQSIQLHQGPNHEA